MGVATCVLCKFNYGHCLCGSGIFSLDIFTPCGLPVVQVQFKESLFVF